MGPGVKGQGEGWERMAVLTITPSDPLGKCMLIAPANLCLQVWRSWFPEGETLPSGVTEKVPFSFKL